MKPARPRPRARDRRGAAAAREPRGARRKRETRERLLDAAFRLIAERGIDAVAINEITEAADVGFGSFYNHFESKADIYRAVIDRFVEQFGNTLDQITSGLDDPAEVLAVCARHVLTRARQEPLWGRLLLREGQSPTALLRRLGARFARDVQRGVETGRFKIPDPLMTLVVLGGGVLAAIAATLTASAHTRTSLGRGDDLPERAAAVLLHALGLTFSQAEAVARRPPPPPPGDLAMTGGVRSAR